jgi:hypothetical protein
MNAATHYQHLRHVGGNDTNGNPRRIFVLYDAQGNIVQTINEGYRGTPSEVRGLVQLPGYSVSASDFRELSKHKGAN